MARKLTVRIVVAEDVVTAKVGAYEASTKADMPEDPKDIIEYLYQEHIIDELLEEIYYDMQ